MTDADTFPSPERGDRPGKTRTWWHPLLARLLDHLLADAYTVLDEVHVGRMPLRLDILLIRQEQGQLSKAARRDLAELLPLLNRFTLIEFKGPTDSLEPGDLGQLIGYSFLWHSQQAEAVSHSDLSLIVLAPRASGAFRRDLRLLGCDSRESEHGVYGIVGLPFATWFVETDVMADSGRPILSLVSRVFLRQHERIIEKLKQTGHGPLLCYTLQQIQQFRSLGEEFAMQHKDSEYLGELEGELKAAVLESIPADDRLRGLSPDDRLRGLSPEEVLQRFTPEELIGGLSKEQLASLRELLKQEQG